MFVQALLKDDPAQDPMDISDVLSRIHSSPHHVSGSTSLVRTSPSPRGMLLGVARSPLTPPPLTPSSPSGSTFMPAARKRLKLSDGTAKPLMSVDLAVMHKKNIDDRMATLKTLKER